ncbi:hypothetical protein Scep_026753 [Stephania cephalantha]|uniref:Uncharacterized protein n=1 Tax=Stephania cephalantha TaxID=152367 RepID=A0AAP0EL66_9MAGN
MAERERERERARGRSVQRRATSQLQRADDDARRRWQSNDRARSSSVGASQWCVRRQVRARDHGQRSGDSGRRAAPESWTTDQQRCGGRRRSRRRGDSGGGGMVVVEKTMTDDGDELDSGSCGAMQRAAQRLPATLKAMRKERARDKARRLVASMVTVASARQRRGGTSSDRSILD